MSELRRMPVDFLRMVTPWLDGACLTRLWLCGDVMLTAHLFSSDAVPEYSIWQGDAPPIVSWPKIVPFLKQLRVFHWRTPKAYSTLTITGSELASLPPTLKVLEIEAINANQLFARPDDPGYLVDGLSSHFPNLEQLIIHGTAHNSWVGRNMDALPHSLRYLGLDELVAQSDFSLQLPYLETLHVRGRSVLLGDALLKLPSSLKSFLLPGLVKVESRDFSNLPQNLEHFQAWGTAPFDTTKKASSYSFPPLLQTFSLQTCNFPSEFLQYLPQGLKKLVIRVGNMSSFTVLPSLPSGLTHLEMPYLPSVATQMLRDLPTTLTYLDMRSAKMEDEYSALLPRTLAALIADSSDNMTNKFLEELPSQLKVLDVANWTLIEDSASPLLPSNLTKLAIGKCALTTDDFVRFLPRTITDLATGVTSNWSADSILLLPPSLKRFYAPHLTTPTDDSIRHLPRTLTSLCIPSAKLLTEQCVSHLPTSITDIFLSSSFVKYAYERRRRKIRGKATLTW